MKKNIILIMLCLNLCSCSSHHSNYLVIRAVSDTVNVGTKYTAELYAPYNQTSPPFFFIIRGMDTIQLPIDVNKKCAVYRAVGTVRGEKTCNGYVEYVNKRGEKEKEPFLIKFYVK